MRYLGLDWGEKHVGIAISIDQFAEPHSTISTEKFEAFLVQEVKRGPIDGLIIGVVEEEPSHKIILLKQRLEEKFKLPVYFQDETLSSHDARQMLLHKSKTYRQSKEHEISATIILQRWLDSR